MAINAKKKYKANSKTTAALQITEFIVERALYILGSTILHVALPAKLPLAGGSAC